MSYQVRFLTSWSLHYSEQEKEQAKKKKIIISDNGKYSVELGEDIT